MTALVTGASSGIGRDIARKLGSMGVRLIITGRDKESLEALRQELGARRVKVIAADISRRDECLRLYREASAYGVDILVNNAGFGLYGKFCVTELDRELDMIDVNIGAVHILTKLFLRDFSARDKGYILNVASIAGFMPGPLMATYYATKNYVLRLTEAVREELRCQRSGVYIGAFCPGPVDTHFNSTAGVKFALRGISSEYAAECAVRGMFARKALILPTYSVKAAVIASRFIPDMLLAAIARLFQSKKG
ncbi:MAG: SDR family oxidoreductase [Oscillospiraceae bacterium]|jgi:short-subunit dehydrogenase|nr:SDR family oxidoreductase [Oscillospiraceae bacterium]